MIIIVTNRKVINETAGNERIFGDSLNEAPDELRVATAKRKTDGTWCVDLQPEKKTRLDAGKSPSRQLFDRMLFEMNEGNVSKRWLFFVHGFNKSFKKNLKKCYALEKLYDVNVIAFSWPSNPGGLLVGAGPVEYRRARGNARDSVAALDRILEALSRYLCSRPFNRNCDIRLSFMSYSLGNRLLEEFVRNPVHYNGEMRMFENIILCQPDVDSKSHGEWMPKLSFGNRIYVTINERDKVLDCADVINPDRLGNTARNLNSPNVIYFDFTGGKNVGNTHGVFYEFNYPRLNFDKRRDKNPVITEVFRRAITGERAEKTPGITYSQKSKAYELDEQE